MSDHVLSITIERGGYFRNRVVCLAADDALCRNMPECNCETWGETNRDDQGWFHYAYGPLAIVPEDKHRHTKPDDCNICEWLNADDPIECLDPSVRSWDLAHIPIKPSWSPDGFYEWSPAW